MSTVRFNTVAETALAVFRSAMLSTVARIDRADISDADHTLLLWRDLHSSIRQLKKLADRIGDAGLQMRDAEKRSNAGR